MYDWDKSYKIALEMEEIGIIKTMEVTLAVNVDRDAHR